MKFAMKFIVGLGVIILVCFLLYKYSIIAINIIGGFIVYLLIAQAIEVIERKGFKEWEAYIVLTCIIGIVITGTALYINVKGYSEVQGFIGEVPSMFRKFQAKIAPIEDEFPLVKETIHSAQEKIQDNIRETISESGAIFTTLITIPII